MDTRKLMSLLTIPPGTSDGNHAKVLWLAIWNTLLAGRIFLAKTVDSADFGGVRKTGVICVNLQPFPHVTDSSPRCMKGLPPQDADKKSS